MSTSLPLSIAILVAGLLVVQPLRAQVGMDFLAPPPVDSTWTYEPPDTSKGDDCWHGAVPWDADSLRGVSGGEVQARWAARMDPGILLYTEPPAGTQMPTFGGDSSVDPEMIQPPRPMDGCND